MLVADHMDIVVVDKQDKKPVAVDVAIQRYSNIRTKEHENHEKNQVLKEELERMWGLKASVVPVVIGAIGAVNPTWEVSQGVSKSQE